MEKLSLTSYVWKCALGAEIVYFICLWGGSLTLGRTPAGEQLHHALFETLPGFVWGNSNSVIIGAVEMLVLAVAFSAYYVWMHNSSLVSCKK